jgi:hypothetical protein
LHALHSDHYKAKWDALLYGNPMESLVWDECGNIIGLEKEMNYISAPLRLLENDQYIVSKLRLKLFSFSENLAQLFLYPDLVAENVFL